MAITPAQATSEDGAGIGSVAWGSGGVLFASGGRGFGDLISDSGFAGGILGPNQLLLLQRMADTDETVGPMLWLTQAVMSQTPWSFIPCTDGVPDDTNPKSVKAAAFMNSVLGDMSRSWTSHVEDALTMLPLGFAPCEIILRQRLPANGSAFSDGLYGIEKIPLRRQTTIQDWKYEGSDLVSVVQFGGYEIPAWKLLNYRTHAVGDVPTGRSMLLNARRPWTFKRRIQDSEAIGIDRDLAGIPTFRVPSDVMSGANERNSDGTMTPNAMVATAKIQSALKAVSTLRMRPTDGLIIESDTYASDDPETKDRTPRWDFKIVTSAGPRTINTREAIRDYDMAIARVLLMQFIQLGTKGGGSYGLSADQSDVAFSSVLAIANKIADEFNRGAVPLIWDVNGMNRRVMPKLVVGKIAREGLAALGGFLNGVGRAVELWQHDVDARMEILDQLGIGGNRDAQEKAVELLMTKAAAPPAPTIFHTAPPAAPAQPQPAPGVKEP